MNHPQSGSIKVLHPSIELTTAIGLFVITLVPMINFMRKHLTVGKNRVVILSSFLIVCSLWFHSVFSARNCSGYTLNGYNVVWPLFFLFACLLAYLGCAGDKNYSGSYAPSSRPQSDYFKPTKEYEIQS